VSRDALLERYAWWASLNHGGMLIAPSKLAGRFAESIEPLPEWRASRLRRDVLRARDGNSESVSSLLDTILEDIVGLHQVRWVKGSDVSKDHTRISNAGEALRPARMWIGDNGARLAVFYPDQASGGLRVPSNYRIGVGRGRRAVVRVVEWLRKSNEKVALLATGRQLRLVHAGSDYEAFCEWDTQLWFQEGAPGPQVDALRLLLSTDAVTPAKPGTPSPLVGAIAESRKGQAELSATLGERVRQAVELLIQASGPQLLPLVHDKLRRVEERDVYLAATRLVMRCVIVLFAEARELLPRTNPIYEQSYGLQALRVELERQSGGRASERLRTCYGAWPRLLGLFSLMFHGSEHEALPLTRYGGALFEPGDEASDEPVRRAIAAFERAEVRDSDVQRILELLTRCPTRVRQGRGSTTVQTPIDFSDLGSEYLGILYEGLLDYELKRAGDDEAVIFLGIGSEPALPFDVLNGMSNDDLAELLKKLGKATKGDDEEEEEEEATNENEDDDESPAEDGDDGGADDSGTNGHDGQRIVREAVQDWAERAVKAAKLERYPRNDRDPRVRDAFARKVTARAKSLVRRLVLPGEWYLVRWGGTRKGAGTFYTRPQLTGPIVRRTLAPLCFEAVQEGEEPRPRTPEQILALKVCDPAMGSGSFLVSALRYLTDALLQSLYVHSRIDQHGDHCYIRLADGLPVDDPSQESLPVPKDDDHFDDILRARLKRHVVERCIYGVDLDALAVELARTALWVETMDYQLPFGFLDHKLKSGNSLVGGWLDRFEDYPMRAWDREGGDAKHTNFVRHFREEKGKRRGDVWNAALKAHREDVILPLLRSKLAKLKAEAAGQTVAEFATDGKGAAAIHAEALAVFEELHGIIPIFEAERRAEVYKTKVLGNPALRALRRALDTWCAVWFWPGDKVDIAPTAGDLLDPRPETGAEVQRLARELRFFHWELEFPDVMTGLAGGFSAIVGNPPWETLQPMSTEFFSNIDPLYRTYGKQEAIRKQTEYFQDRIGAEDGWTRYNANFNALANWGKNVAHPFGDHDIESDDELLTGVDRSLTTAWAAVRRNRIGFSDQAHPYRYQGGGKPFTYKLFLEVAHVLLRSGGSLGFLVPSGLYTDNGSQALRNLFLDRCAWTHLYAFQNERFVFEGIHHSFKMAVTHARKGERTSALRTRFRLGPGDSPEASEIEEDLSDDARFLLLPLEQIARFSPTTRSILEVRTARDLRILEKLYANGVLLGDKGPDGWGITYRQGDFNMTSDSALFPPRPQWEAKGYKPDEYGHWLKGPWRRGDGLDRDGNRNWSVSRSTDGSEVIAADKIEDVGLPLYQGRMVHNFDFSAAAWVSGTGLRAVWSEVPWTEKRINPQFLVRLADATANERLTWRPRLVFRDIARSTDERTMIASVLRGLPCGHVVGVLECERPLELLAVTSSFAFDWHVRERMGGTHLTWNVLEELVLPNPRTVGPAITGFVERLAAAALRFAPEFISNDKFSWRRLWAITAHERVRLRAIIDAAISELYGFDEDDFRWILRDCDYPEDQVCDSRVARSLNPKGFWRVDKEKAPELRHPILSLIAFSELKKVGLDQFLALNDGDGWQLPETLRLADYGLGHDVRAKEHQPVAAALGERFLPWQLGEDVEASWEECRRHTELIGRIMSCAATSNSGTAETTAPGAGTQLSLMGGAQPMNLIMKTKKGKKG
jgi:hypothetical protein